MERLLASGMPNQFLGWFVETKELPISKEA
jgi:hypothetical protein